MDCRKQKPDDTNRKKWQNNEKENKTQTYNISRQQITLIDFSRF